MKIFKVSMCVNTCALGARAKEVTGNHTSTPHAVRSYALGNFILPAYCADPYIAEVIVSGEWCSGDGYTYIPVPSRYFSSDDAIAQRQASFAAATGDILIFAHDDHILAPGTAREIAVNGLEADVVVLERKIRSSKGDLALNNGRRAGYIGGHAVAYKREVLERLPWGCLPAIHEWDVAQTLMMRQARFSLSWPEDLVVFDVEVGANH